MFIFFTVMTKKTHTQKKMNGKKDITYTPTLESLRVQFFSLCTMILTGHIFFSEFCVLVFFAPKFGLFSVQFTRIS